MKAKLEIKVTEAIKDQRERLDQPGKNNNISKLNKK
jgi:hypothetical protein